MDVFRKNPHFFKKFIGVNGKIFNLFHYKSVFNLFNNFFANFIIEAQSSYLYVKKCYFFYSVLH